MRMIDADALIGELHTTYLYDDNARKVIYRKIEEQPTIVPEKEHQRRVTWTGWKGYRDTRYKCPNCQKPVKNDDVYKEWGDTMCCMRLGSYYGNTMPTDYCSYAKRREEQHGSTGDV